MSGSLQCPSCTHKFEQKPVRIQSIIASRHHHPASRPSMAYTTGTKKRRKIQMTEINIVQGETRWHKTGKTKPVIVKGEQKGCKTIMVLYTNPGKNRKPEMTNWVMHQYHLGAKLEDEKEGEFVVSKMFYQTQPRQMNCSAVVGGVGEGGSGGVEGAGEKDSRS